MWNDLPLDVTSEQSCGFQTVLSLFSFLREHSYMTYHFFFFFSGIPCGPCNKSHYLGHIKHVNDDDSDVEHTALTLQHMANH